MDDRPGPLATDPARQRPADVLGHLVTGVCARRPDLDRLYSEPTRVTHPLAGDDVLETRQQLRDHFTRAHTALGDVEMSVSKLVVHETVDPEWIVGEFSYMIGQAAIAVPCVFVMRVRDGLIVESRDYMDLAMFRQAIATARER